MNEIWQQIPNEAHKEVARVIRLKKPTHGYHAFLLRLWHEEDSQHVRATIEDAHTRERLGFSELQHLFAFLERVTRHQIEEESEK